MDWNDFRYLLAVADAGSLSGGARALGVNHSTALRRIAAFESELGLRLFERLPSGYVLTPGGEALVTAARQMADTVSGVERRVLGQDLRLSGAVRVATTDTLSLAVLPRLFARFRARHPDVQIEVNVSNLPADLTRRDADLAIRPTARPPESLVGRKLARIAYALYASAGYLEAQPARRALSRHVWVAPDESMASTTVGRFMAREVPEAAVSFRANSLAVLARAAAAGLGVAALPCYLGDSSADLHRVRGPLPDYTVDLWALTHADLRNTARVRAVIDSVSEGLLEVRNLLEGRGD
jgi:DNA-binding transcriptional LysR family regulator